MRSLEHHQRSLLALIKKRPADLNGDTWLRGVNDSKQLAMVRDIALWWRRYQIEAQCRYTSRLLKRLGCFEEVVAEYFDRNATSPFIEEVADHFLGTFRHDDSSLVRSVALFEQALLRTCGDTDEVFEVEWDRHPSLVFEFLETKAPLPPPEDGYQYKMRIGRNIPNWIECARE